MLVNLVFRAVFFLLILPYDKNVYVMLTLTSVPQTTFTCVCFGGGQFDGGIRISTQGYMHRF